MAWAVAAPRNLTSHLPCAADAPTHLPLPRPTRAAAPSPLPLCSAPSQVDLSRYTLDTYMRIVTYKTAFYTFYLPVACGLRLAGVT